MVRKYAWIGLLGIGIIASIPLLLWPSQKNFDSRAWLASDPYKTSERLNMLNDLTEHHLKTGMSKKNVEAMLGEAKEVSPNEITYFVGVKKTLLGTWVFLRISFDDEKIVDYQVIFD